MPKSLVRRKSENSGRPVFMIGCQRSGTTLARYFLDSHPNLACPPESKFIAGLKQFHDYPQSRSALLSLGIDEDDVLRELRAMIEKFLGGYARRQGKPRWIDKTPNYFTLLPFIDAVFEGEALYLLITRHPLDCITSLFSFYATRRQYEDPQIRLCVRRHGRGFHSWACYWNDVYGRIHDFSLTCPERCHVFRYEDLVRLPNQTLRRVLAFIGETLPPNLIRTAFTMPHATGYEDPGIRGTNGLKADRIGKWKDWPPHRIATMWSLVGQTAVRYGYTVNAEDQSE
jgi:protein-tyrosine sulfotransferase